MRVQVFSTTNQKPLGNLILQERPKQGEYVDIAGTIYRIEKVIHQQNVNFALTLHVCP